MKRAILYHFDPQHNVAWVTLYPLWSLDSQHIKSFLTTVKTNLRGMIRVVNVRNEVSVVMDSVSCQLVNYDVSATY